MANAPSVPNGGVPGLPGVKKNKDMNSYANGGAVSGVKLQKGTARGGGAAVKGLDFTVV
jgi:hypothetical protein